MSKILSSLVRKIWDLFFAGVLWREKGEYGSQTTTTKVGGAVLDASKERMQGKEEF